MVPLTSGILTSGSAPPTLVFVRTTVRIDDDVLQAAKSLARSEGRTVGEVLTELARKGLTPVDLGEGDAGFPVFSVPAGAKPITPEMVRQATED
jgi:hypothetical protein